jgi:hypothetical protein
MLFDMVAIIHLLDTMLCFVSGDGRYNINIVDIGSNCFTNAQRIIHSYCNELIEDTKYQTACFVRELLLLRENALILSYNDLKLLFNVVCPVKIV